MNTETIPIANRMPPEAVDVLILLGALAGVALVVFFCILIFRKDERQRRHHHHHRHHHRKTYREQFRQTTSGIKELIRQRRHRSHHERRQLNPTLAQTGGLPPIRPPDKPPDKPSGPTPPAAPTP